MSSVSRGRIFLERGEVGDHITYLIRSEDLMHRRHRRCLSEALDQNRRWIDHRLKQVVAILALADSIQYGCGFPTETTDAVTTKTLRTCMTPDETFASLRVTTRQRELKIAMWLPTQPGLHSGKGGWSQAAFIEGPCRKQHVQSEGRIITLGQTNQKSVDATASLRRIGHTKTPDGRLSFDQFTINQGRRQNIDRTFGCEFKQQEPGICTQFGIS
jgi:hypothetical protein